MQVPTLSVMFLLVVVFSAAISDEASGFVCKTGVPYRENDCNGCACHNGNLACTLKACIGPGYEKLYRCIPGPAYKKDCNECQCVLNYGTICTGYNC